MEYCYIRASGIRKLAKDNGKRCSADFLDELNKVVYELVQRGCGVWNGNRKTLDRTIAQVITKQLKI